MSASDSLCRGSLLLETADSEQNTVRLSYATGRNSESKRLRAATRNPYACSADPAYTRVTRELAVSNNESGSCN